ncbi:MAG: helix-turn-helix domain-containing protein [Pseudomonadota bacterium]|nr:helix-turn-helix domain-containing protein [Pseudomonadota bacterium]
MRTTAADFTTPETRRTAKHLGRLVREARLARRMPQTELAIRAKTSKLTVIRIEKGAVETALGTWLSVLEQLGLLGHILSIEDPISAELAKTRIARRARLSAKPDLDF